MKKLILSFFVCFLLASTQEAFSQKFGHLNSVDLLDKMPEKAVADRDLETFGKTLQTELQNQMSTYNTKYDEYQSKASLMADAIRKVKEKEIMDLQQSIQEFQTNAQQNLETKRSELYKPILTKADEAVKAVAKNGGFTYIFDTSAGTLLYFSESEDILPLVLKQLGI